MGGPDDVEEPAPLLRPQCVEHFHLCGVDRRTHVRLDALPRLVDSALVTPEDFPDLPLLRRVELQLPSERRYDGIRIHRARRYDAHRLPTGDDAERKRQRAPGDEERNGSSGSGHGVTPPPGIGTRIMRSGIGGGAAAAMTLRATASFDTSAAAHSGFVAALPERP